MERSSTSSSSSSLPRTASTPTSTIPRSRRSNINLADLRLSPLSTRYTEPNQTLAPNHGSTDKSSTLSTEDLAYSASDHGSYLANRSAPTTPGILSRNSSKRSLASAAGLPRSRRNSLYSPRDEEAQTQYREDSIRKSQTLGGTDLPKARSEAALLVHRSRALAALRIPNLEARQRSQPGTAGRRNHSRRATGDPIPWSSGALRTAAESSSRSGVWDQEWLLRTSLAASAAVRGFKGRGWLASSTYHGSSAHLQDTTDEDTDEGTYHDDEVPMEVEVEVEEGDDDEGYEELAALSSTSTSRSSRRARGGQHGVKGTALAAELAGLSTSRKQTSASASAGAWGSRYGSRDPSRRGSRRGSTSDFNSKLTLTNLSGPRTPVPAAAATAGTVAEGRSGGGGRRDYFEDAAYAMSLQPRFLDGDGDGEGDDESSADETLSHAHVISLTNDARSFGFGGLVDRIMGFGSLFNLEEGGETTGTEESEGESRETIEEGRERLRAEAARRREEKARLSLRKAGEDGEGDGLAGSGGGDGKGGWSDAAWLLSVAGRAIWSDGV